MFLPFKTGTAWLWAGLGLFAVGLGLLVAATVGIIRAEESKPFTFDIYRYSRNPMYLAMIVIYLAVSVATASWIFLLVTIATFFLQRQQICRKKTTAYASSAMNTLLI